MENPFGTNDPNSIYRQNSGSYFAEFNQFADRYGAISQTLATTPGQTYTISFYGRNNVVTTNPATMADNAIRLYFGGVSVFNAPLLTNSYQQYTVTGVATGMSTTFEVQGYNNPGDQGVDDFVITAVPTPPGIPTTTTPEPSTWALLASGLGALGAVARRRRVSNV